MPIDLKARQDEVIVKELFQGRGREQEQDRNRYNFQDKIIFYLNDFNVTLRRKLLYIR